MFGWLISASDAQSCPEVPSVKNSVSVAEQVEGQILGTYFCVDGYHLEGKKTFVCNGSEEWDASTTKCHLGHCPDPILENGEFNSSGPVNVSDIITFKCNDRYVLKGSTWSQCLEDHSWAPPVPTCKSRDCGPPPKPAHGSFKGGNFTSGSIITYYCDKRYHLVGASEQQCVDGEWSGPLPACELIQVAPAPAPQTGFEKVLFAFQESKDLCEAAQSFMRRLKEHGFTVEDLKYSLEMEKAELKAKMLSGHHS